MDASTTIVCGESVQRSFQCSANVLTASSTFFKHLLLSPLERNPYTLTVPNIKPDVLERVLRFFTTNDSQLIQADNVLELLSAADYLGAPLLKTACIDFLLTHAEPSEYAALLTFGKDRDCTELCVSLRDNILRNGRQFFGDDNHLQMSAGQMMSFMSSDDLTMSREEGVWHALLRWLDVDPVSRREEFMELTTAVRFALLEENHLHKIVNYHFSDDAVLSKMQSILRETMQLLADSPSRAFELEHNGPNRLRNSGYAHGVITTVKPCYDDTLFSHYLRFEDLETNTTFRLKNAPDTRSPDTPRHPYQVAASADADGTLYLLTHACQPNSILHNHSRRTGCFTTSGEARLWHYNGRSDEWIENGVLSRQESILGMCILGKSVYILCKNVRTPPEIVRYSLETKQVESVCQLPCRKVSTSPLLLLDGLIYIFHADHVLPLAHYFGINGMRETVVFDTRTQTCQQKAPSHLWHDNDVNHCVCATPAGLIYSLSKTAQGTGLERYDPSADTWTIIDRNVPVFLLPSAMVYFRGQYVVVLVGMEKRSRKTVTQKIVYDETTNTWHDFQSPPDVEPLRSVPFLGGMSHTTLCTIRKSALETLPHCHRPTANYNFTPSCLTS